MRLLSILILILILWLSTWSAPKVTVPAQTSVTPTFDVHSPLLMDTLDSAVQLDAVVN